ncbi:MAG: PLP-dependent aminotransferase family protein [Coriobacteriia bacterium]|nr:PLP-dependent aminotransferase family protein [Coriobacteriia bacterium]
MASKARRELLLTIDETSDEPRYRQVYAQICEAILQGRLNAGDKLPSIRKLSQTLQVSHTTIEQAYLQLSVEGYVRNVPRSGYVVETLDTAFLRIPAPDNEPGVRRAEADRSRNAFYAENAAGGQARFDFSYANLQPDSFPLKTWRTLTNDVLFANTAPDLARYSYTHEPNSLRRALARHLNQTRGVNCLPEQVVVQAGTDGAIATILQLLDREKHVVGLEEPGYATVREVAQRMGFKLVPIPSDQGLDAFLEALYRYNPKVVFTTPSHQFPTGNILPLEGRTELLKWAKKTNGIIIEDDSCNEYRYSTSPIPSLQSLDSSNRVIYLCNVSKVLSPALRIAYMVLPPKFLGRYLRVFNFAHPAVSWLDQEVLARFIAEGHWDAHVRKMAKGNHRRHDLLLQGLTEAFGDLVSISGADAGMHLYVGVKNGMTQRELVHSAYEQGANVYSTARFWFSKPADQDKLMLGFSAIADADIIPGVEALRRAWL